MKVLLASLLAAGALAAPLPKTPTHTNSIGMSLVRIAPGQFTMGFDGAPLADDVAEAAWRRGGDWDEKPAHRVRITRAFYVG